MSLVQHLHPCVLVACPDGARCKSQCCLQACLGLRHNEAVRTVIGRWDVQLGSVLRGHEAHVPILQEHCEVCWERLS